MYAVIGDRATCPKICSTAGINRQGQTGSDFSASLFCQIGNGTRPIQLTVHNKRINCTADISIHHGTTNGYGQTGILLHGIKGSPTGKGAKEGAVSGLNLNTVQLSHIIFL